MTALEIKLAKLESFLFELRKAPSRDRDTMIQEMRFVDHLPPAPNLDLITPAQSPVGSNVRRASIECIIQQTGWQRIFNPYDTYTGTIMTAFQPERGNYSVPHLDSPTTFQTSIMKECISLFFQWQHVDCQIVESDIFYGEYSTLNSNSRTITSALVYSMCSLGALNSSVSHIRRMADQFFESAQSLLLGPSLLYPQIPTVQALLCCAFYEYGRNNSAQGWIYSGISNSCLFPCLGG